MSRSRLQSLNSNIDHMKCSLSSKNSPRNTVDFEAACSVYIRFRGVNGYPATSPVSSSAWSPTPPVPPGSRRVVHPRGWTSPPPSDVKKTGYPWYEHSSRPRQAGSSASGEFSSELQGWSRGVALLSLGGQGSSPRATAPRRGPAVRHARQQPNPSTCHEDPSH